jgi:hypothetical protein
MVFRGAPDAPPGQRYALMVGAGMARTTKPHLWEEHLEALAPRGKVTVYEGVKVFDGPEPPIPAIGPTQAFALPDPQTVVPSLPGPIPPRLLEAWQRAPLESVAWADDWGLVQGCTLAFVLDNARGDWSEGYDGNTESTMLAHPEQCTQEEYWRCLAANSRYAVCGVDWRGDCLSVLVIVEFESPDAASDAAAGLPELVAKMQAKVMADLADGDLEAYRSFCIGLFDQIESRISGSKIRLSANTKLDPNLVATCVSHAFLPSKLKPRHSSRSVTTEALSH